MKHPVDIEYTYGYTFHPRGICGCGWVGPTRAYTFRARMDANRHWKANNSWKGEA